jgi:histidine ammonia-lyase
VAHLLRALAQLDGAVGRVLAGVSTSPALIEGRFVGTTGFDGFDLAAAADGLRLAVLHVAEVAAARLHRMLDPRVTGLPSQLSAEPGRQAGLVALHKRAVGLLHEARRAAAPASLGATDTSLGQEDVQSFALEATLAAHAALRVLRDVTACELVAVHQARLLDPSRARGPARLQAVLQQAFEALADPLPDHPDDRATGRDVAALRRVLAAGWAPDVLGSAGDAPSHTPPMPS